MIVNLRPEPSPASPGPCNSRPVRRPPRHSCRPPRPEERELAATGASRCRPRGSRAGQRPLAPLRVQSRWPATRRTAGRARGDVPSRPHTAGRMPTPAARRCYRSTPPRARSPPSRPRRSGGPLRRPASSAQGRRRSAATATGEPPSERVGYPDDVQQGRTRDRGVLRTSSRPRPHCSRRGRTAAASPRIRVEGGWTCGHHRPSRRRTVAVAHAEGAPLDPLRVPCEARRRVRHRPTASPRCGSMTARPGTSPLASALQPLRTAVAPSPAT